MIESDKNELLAEKLKKLRMNSDEIKNSVEIDADIFASPKSGYGMIWLSNDPDFLTPEQLKEKLGEKPSFVKYNNAVYYIDNDWKPTKMSHQSLSLLNRFPTIQDSYVNLSAAQMIDYARDCGLAKVRFNSKINIFRKMSFASWQDLSKVSIEVMVLLNPPTKMDSPEIIKLKEELQTAIWNGGVRLQELVGLNMEAIKQIVCPEALALYEKNEYVRPKDVLSTSDLREKKETSETKASTSASSTPPIHESSSPVFRILDLISASVAREIIRLQNNHSKSSFFQPNNKKILEEALSQAKAYCSSPEAIIAFSSKNNVEIIKSILDLKNPGKLSLSDLMPTLFAEVDESMSRNMSLRY
jgi:hypothetical protein